MSLDPKNAVQASYDLGLATLQMFTKGEFNVTLDHPDYFMCNEIIPGGEIKDGGKYFTFEVVLGKTGNAAHVGYFENYTPNVKNIMKEGLVHWAHAHTSYSYDIDEVNINSNEREVYNLLKSRRSNSDLELADELEPRGWVAPDTATDDLHPFGVFGWLAPPSTTDGAEGFIGGKTGYLDSSSATLTISPGGIDPTTANQKGWYSYAANYGGSGGTPAAKVITSNLLDYLGTAMRKTAFVAPLKAEAVLDMKLNKLRVFTTNEVIKQLEKIARLSDDQVGYDLGKYNGLTTYKRLPLNYVSWLEDTDQYGGTNPIFNKWCSGYNPVVGVNFNHFKCYILRGCNFRELPPMSDVQTPNVFTIHKDLQYIYVCNNRQRAGFLITQY